MRDLAIPREMRAVVRDPQTTMALLGAALEAGALALERAWEEHDAVQTAVERLVRGGGERTWIDGKELTPAGVLHDLLGVDLEQVERASALLVGGEGAREAVPEEVARILRSAVALLDEWADYARGVDLRGGGAHPDSLLGRTQALVEQASWVRPTPKGLMGVDPAEPGGDTTVRTDLDLSKLEDPDGNPVVVTDPKAGSRALLQGLREHASPEALEGIEELQRQLDGARPPERAAEGTRDPIWGLQVYDDGAGDYVMRRAHLFLSREEGERWLEENKHDYYGDEKPRIYCFALPVDSSLTHLLRQHAPLNVPAEERLAGRKREAGAEEGGAS